MGKLGRSIGGIAKSIGEFGGSIFNGIGRVAKSISGFVTGIAEVGKGAGPIAQFVKFLGGIFRPFMSIGGAFLKGFSAVTKIFEMIPGLGTFLIAIDAAVGIWKGFTKDGIKGIFIGAIAGIISGFTGLFGLSFETLYEYLMMPFDWIQDRLTDLFYYIFRAWDIAVDSITYLFTEFPKKVLKFVTNAISSIWNGIMGFFGAIWSGITWVSNKVTGFVMGTVDMIWSGVTGFFGSICDGFSYEMNHIKLPVNH